MTTELPLSQFRVDADTCTGCGRCAADCPMHILKMEGNTPHMRLEDDAECLACQHCLAVCPVAAVSVAGKNPADSKPTEYDKLDARAIERTIYARRSVRQFTPEPVAEETIRRLVDIANHAPTAVNARDLHFTVVTDADAMRDLRKRSCERLVANASAIPENTQWIVDVARNWLNGGVDGIFREAPHVIVATGGKGQYHTKVDSVIALSCFEFAAVPLGVGTTWCGMFDNVLRAVPECRKWLGIPDDREIGYAMLFGNASVRYPRSAQHAPASLNLVKGLA